MKTHKVKQVVLMLSEENFFDTEGKPITGITGITSYKGGIVLMTKKRLYSSVSIVTPLVGRKGKKK